MSKVGEAVKAGVEVEKTTMTITKPAKEEVSKNLPRSSEDFFKAKEKMDKDVGIE